MTEQKRLLIDGLLIAANLFCYFYFGSILNLAVAIFLLVMVALDE